MPMTPQEERQLLDECKNCTENNKNCQIKDKIVHEYFDFVKKAVSKVLRYKVSCFAQEDVKDLTNDAFVKLFEKECKRLKKYDEKKGHGLKRWIALISNHTVLNSLAKKDPHNIPGYRKQIPIDDFKEELGLKNEMRRLESRDILARIEKKLEKLSPAQRLVIQCLYYQYPPLSPSEIADMTNRETNAVYQLRSDAVRNLKKWIKY